MQRLVFFTVLIFSLVSNYVESSEIKEYKGTDNAGLNKYERINYIETYLERISKDLKSLQDKVDSDSTKIESLNQKIESLSAWTASKDNDAKKEKLEKLEGKNPNIDEQIIGLKAQIDSLKTKDISNLSDEVQSLQILVRNLESILRK